jgi:hypothetical protein
MNDLLRQAKPKACANQEVCVGEASGSLGFSPLCILKIKSGPILGNSEQRVYATSRPER